MMILRQGFFLLNLAAIGACGGVAVSNPGATAKTEPQDAGISDTGSMALTSGPSSLVMSCPSALAPVALALPCSVGQSLGEGINVTECDLSGVQNDATQRVPPISLMVRLAELDGMLNMPVKIPFDNLPPLPPGGYGILAAYPGEHFSGSMVGTAIFSQVDVSARSFTGQLQHAQFDWTGDGGHSFSCNVTDGPFWAVAGDFM